MVTPATPDAPTASALPAPADATPVLSCRALSKRFGAFTALHDASFDLYRGEIVGFLGPNGAGKSTTMKLLTGFLAPSSGNARIAGYDLDRDPLACRARIGYLPEELPLYLDMRVDAYLDHLARLKHVPASARRRQIVDAIAACHLGENAKRSIRTLSKGNRQRVGLAQALLGEPDLLILDEPTTGLDPTQVSHFRDLLRQLATRHTILLSTHILAEVDAVCTRAVIITRGRTVADAPIATLRNAGSGQPRVRLRLRQSDPTCLPALRSAGFAVIDGSDAVTTGLLIATEPERRGALAALAETHGGLAELREERRSLDEVFAELTGAQASAAAPAAAPTAQGAATPTP